MVKRNMRDLPSSLPRKKLDIVIEVSMMAHNALRPQLLTSFPSLLRVGFVSCGPRMIAKGPSIPSTHLVQVIDPSGISRTPGKCSEKVRECWEKDTPIPSTHTRTHTRTHTHTHTPHCPHRCSGLSHFFFRSGQSQVLTAQWCKFSWDKCSFSLWSWTF